MGTKQRIFLNLMAASTSAFALGCSTVETQAIAFKIGDNLKRCQPIVRTRNGIIGGKAVDGSDPDQNLVTMLKIRRDGRDHVCTGTLLSNQLVLTAAHCVDGVSPKSVEVKFVTKEGCLPEHLQTVELEVEKFEIHEEFDGSPESFADVAIVMLKNTAPLDQQRVPLLPVGKVSTNDVAVLLGFGITHETQKDSQVLRRIEKSLARDFKFEGRKILVNQSSGSGGFCRGDSGAPIIVEIYGEPYIAGVNSANIGIKKNTECQTASIAMSTDYFTPWITDKRAALESKSLWDYIVSGAALIF